MPAPRTPPIGLHLASAARAVSRAFDGALGAAGGSMPVWLVLLNLKMRGQMANQRELAAAVGIREATLTHHLNAMESDGLLTRRRDPGNRRVHVVELTEAGRSLSARLERALDELDATLADVAGLADADGGKVRVASSPTLSAYLMPTCIAACAREAPRVRFVLLDRIQQGVSVPGLDEERGVHRVELVRRWADHAGAHVPGERLRIGVIDAIDARGLGFSLILEVSEWLSSRFAI